MVDGDYGNVVDAVLLWWRDEDGDLVDGLVDALTDLVGGGAIWLLTPKVGRPNAVDPADIAEAAPIAGLVADDHGGGQQGLVGHPADRPQDPRLTSLRERASCTVTSSCPLLDSWRQAASTGTASRCWPSPGSSGPTRPLALARAGRGAPAVGHRPGRRLRRAGARCCPTGSG